MVDDAVAICSVMWVNNEVGTVQPIPSFARASATNAAS